MPFLGIANDDAKEPQDTSDVEALERLKKLCTLGRHEHEAVVLERLDHELQVIHELGLDEFFLALVAIHRIASSQGHVVILVGY